MATKPGGKFVKPGATVAAALLISLGLWEGRKLTPYYDAGGVETWCDGITAPGTTPKARYTPAECDELLASHLYTDVEALKRCIPLSLMPQEMQFAAQHMAYNIGAPALCRSSMAKRWRAGDYSPESCRVILKYTYVAGQDCRKTGTRCPGIVKRRDYEHGVCTGEIDWREQAWHYEPPKG